MKPYILTPTCKDYIWGGDRLIKQWNKKTDKNIVAECWELSCHADGASYVDGKGTLKELLAAHPEYLGTKAQVFDNFPILIKLIDSKSNLSIQVHPSDDYALKNEGQYGKTEMWYIVDADKGAGVYCGFKKQLSKQEISERLKDGSICDALNFIEVKVGDSLFIEAGTVHAICGGLLICEVQQNSSLTYRLYDYDRIDACGNKRELHIDKSLDVIVANKIVAPNVQSLVIEDGYKLLAKCKYFTTYEISGNIFNDNATSESFVAINCLTPLTLGYDDGSLSCNKGDTVFIPSGLGAYTLYGDNIVAIKTIID